MGRGKIEMKKIEDTNSRQVTYSKRRAGLFKKARELAILCDAEVAVIIFSNTGKIAEFASSSMQQILATYQKVVGMNVVPAVEHKPEEPKEVGDLKEEMANLKIKQLRLLGKGLNGMCLQELRTLEQELNEMLNCIKDRKEQILMQQLEQSMMENEELRKQVEEFQGFSPSTTHPKPLSVVLPNGGVANEVLDTTLQLGLSSGVYGKRKTPEDETQSHNSDTQVGLRRSFSCEYPPVQREDHEI